MSATPRPWTLVRDEIVGDWLIRGADGQIVAILGDDMLDEAELIVPAVNAHDELVAALEALMGWSTTSPPLRAPEAVVEQVRAALAKARGEPA